MKHADLHQIPTVAVVALLLGCAVFVSSACSAMKRGDRPRIIATTDGEIDDRCSMVRFLMYANEWDIEGIVYSASKFHWDNHKWAGTKWIEDQIDQYAKVYENLKTQSANRLNCLFKDKSSTYSGQSRTANGPAGF